MYHNQSYQQQNRNRYNNQSVINRRFPITNKRRAKPLDPNLFINKFSDQVVAETPFVCSATFDDYALTTLLRNNIQAHGYVNPTQIQEQAIPPIMSGRDVIGLANTGTGKTAAFLVSLINKAYLDRKQRVLIVVPTRELASQIQDEFNIFSRGMGFVSANLIGGMSIRNQQNDLRKNPQFVIGTPGRLKDLIKTRFLNLSLFQNVVLDEVDRMVDIGFIHDIEYLISLMPAVRQSLFFSATIDSRTKDILNRFVNNPVTISVKRQESAINVDQDIIRLPKDRSKIDILHDLLNQPGYDKVLVFGRTKWGMEKLAKALAVRGVKVAAIHGNKTQFQRQKALSEFKCNAVQVLTATDIAARGLDIQDVTHVINYDAPTTYEDYVHRIGRTGRAGKRGVALTFIE